MSYTLDRFGSYTSVMRYLWGDDSEAVRTLLYNTWIAVVKNTNCQTGKLKLLKLV